MKTVAALLVLLMATACAGTPRVGEMRQYACTDGTAFSLEVSERWVRLRTATGPIELPQERHPDHDRFYTNGLRSIVMAADGSLRHAHGRRAWTDCERSS